MAMNTFKPIFFALGFKFQTKLWLWFVVGLVKLIIFRSTLLVQLKKKLTIFSTVVIFAMPGAVCKGVCQQKE